jgi:hypothetical protein
MKNGIIYYVRVRYWHLYVKLRFNKKINHELKL